MSVTNLVFWFKNKILFTAYLYCKKNERYTFKILVMKNRIFTLTILLAVLFVGSEVYAKKTFEGQVTTVEGKVMTGTIYVISPTLNELKVKFVDAKNKKYNFKAKELKSYSFEVSKYNRETRTHETKTITYVRKVVEDAPVRMGTTDILIERQVDGAIQVYNQYVEEDEKIGGTLGHYFYAEKKDASLDFTKLTKKNYRDVLKAATSDFPELANKIGTQGFGYRYIIKIAELYNLNAARSNDLSMAN